MRISNFHVVIVGPADFRATIIGLIFVCSSFNRERLVLSKFVNRCAELNRREVDEKAEHLRLLSWLTGLITSFTMTTPVEFNFDSAVSTVT